MSQRWATGAAVAMVAAAAVASAACGRGDSSGASAERQTIAFFTKNQTNPYFQSIRQGADSAGRELNVSVMHFVPTRPDSIPEQMSQVEDVAVRRPDAVAFIPVDAKAMVPGVERLNSAGIPVVNVTDRSAGGQFVSFVGCDEYVVARNTARRLLTAMNGKGRVVIIEGVRGSTNNATRMRGYTDALAEFKDVTLLATQPGNFQRLQALQVMENMLQSYRELDGVLALNDAMALGAVEALEAANRKALVVGINGTKEAVDAVREGKLLASGDCDGFLHGCGGVMAAVRHLRKEPVPADIEFAVEVIDQANASKAGVLQENRSCPSWESLVKR
jgi:ribose transport system substrate-binding protein